jgi:hypothetical protein
MTRDPRVREHIEQIARMVLEDQIEILEATRALLPLLHGDPEVVPPDDHNLFRGIDSETVDLVAVHFQDVDVVATRSSRRPGEASGAVFGDFRSSRDCQLLWPPPQAAITIGSCAPGARG